MQRLSWFQVELREHVTYLNIALKNLSLFVGPEPFNNIVRRGIGQKPALASDRLELDRSVGIPDSTMTEVTGIVSDIQKGDSHAAEKLLPLVYDEWRKLAAQKLAQENPSHVSLCFRRGRVPFRACCPERHPTLFIPTPALIAFKRQVLLVIASSQFVLQRAQRPGDELK